MKADDVLGYTYAHMHKQYRCILCVIAKADPKYAIYDWEHIPEAERARIADAIREQVRKRAESVARYGRAA